LLCKRFSQGGLLVNVQWRRPFEGLRTYALIGFEDARSESNRGEEEDCEESPIDRCAASLSHEGRI